MRSSANWAASPSKLHNYFHYNPWATPDENIQRSAAHMYRQRPELYNWTSGHGHNHPHGPPDFQYPDYPNDAQVRHIHGRGAASSKPKAPAKKKRASRK